MTITTTSNLEPILREKSTIQQQIVISFAGWFIPKNTRHDVNQTVTRNMNVQKTTKLTNKLRIPNLQSCKTLQDIVLNCALKKSPEGCGAKTNPNFLNWRRLWGLWGEFNINGPNFIVIYFHRPSRANVKVISTSLSQSRRDFICVVISL